MQAGRTHFRIAVALLCAISTASPAVAQDGNAGRIFFPETAFDYGVVPQGAVVQHEFPVENRGSGPLTISRVVAQCGCTATNASKDLLQPGERGSIKVNFDTSNFSGDREKTVTVFSSDPETQMVTLFLRGRIEPGVLLRPDRLLFGDVARGMPVTQEFSAEVAPGSRMVILEARSFSRYITVQEKEGDSHRKVFSVTIGPDVPMEEFRARISLRVQGKDGRQRDVDVPVFASVKGILRLNPPVLSLGILEGKDVIRRSVKLEYMGPGEATLKSVESSSSAVKGTVVEAQKGKGRVFLLSVEADPESVTRDLKAAVTVTMLAPDGREESVSLNVYGILPPR